MPGRLAGPKRLLPRRLGHGGGPGHGSTWSNTNSYAALEYEPGRRIDCVFAGLPLRSGLGQILVCRVVCDDEVNSAWPSDHFGVCAELCSEPDAG